MHLPWPWAVSPYLHMKLSTSTNVVYAVFPATDIAATLFEKLLGVTYSQPVYSVIDDYGISK